MSGRLKSGDIRRLQKSLRDTAFYDWPLDYIGTGTSATNVSLTVDSNGISISANPPGAGGSVNFSAGTTSSNVSAVTFSNGNGVTFGFDGSNISASVAPPGAGSLNISAGTTSSNVSAVTFSNANGVTFGFDGTNVSASVQTNYQTPGAYLTTAALSQDSSKYAGTSTGMAGGSVTLNTAGISISLPAYLTTAALSQDSSKYAGTSTGIAGGSVTLNTAGISISLPAYLTTAQPPGAYLTTAALSQDSSKYAGTNGSVATTAGTDLALTLNTSGATIGYPKWLTTAAATNITSDRAGTSTAMAGGSVTLDTNGISISLPTYLTTALATNTPLVQSLDGSSGQLTIVGSGLNTVSNNASTIVVSARSESLNEIQNPATDVNFSMGTRQFQFQYNIGGSFSTNATRQGMFEIDVLGNVTAEADVMHIHQHGGAPTILDMVHVEADGTNATAYRAQVSATVAAEFNQPIKFTTEDAGYAIGSVPMILGTQMSNSVANLNANYLQGSQASQFAASNVTSARAGTNTSVITTAGTDLSFAVNTSGVTIAYPKWLTAATGGGGAGTNTSVATTAGTDLTLGVDTSGVTIGYPKWITTYVNDLTSARAGTGTSVVTTAGTDLSMALDTAGLTVAYPKWITSAPPSPLYIGYFEPPYPLNNTQLFAAVAGSWYFQPFAIPGPISGGRINLLHINTSTAGLFRDITGAIYASASTGTLQQSYTYSQGAALYSQGTGSNSTRLESFWSNNFSWAWSKDVRVSLSQATNINVSVSHSISYISDIGSNGAYTLNQFASNRASSMGNSSTVSNWGDSIAVSIRNMISNSLIQPIGLNTTISAGNYWLAMAWSTTRASASTGGALASALDFAVSSEFGITRQAFATAFRNWGSTNTVANSGLVLYGVYTGAANMAPPQFVAISSDLSSLANMWMPYFNIQYRGITK